MALCAVLRVGPKLDFYKQACPPSSSPTLSAHSAASAAAALSPPSLTAHAFTHLARFPSQLIHQSNLDAIVSAIARLADSPGKPGTSHANTPDVRLQGVECCVALHTFSPQGAESVIMCLAHNGAICDRLKEALALEVPCCPRPGPAASALLRRCVPACALIAFSPRQPSARPHVPHVCDQVHHPPSGHDKPLVHRPIRLALAGALFLEARCSILIAARQAQAQALTYMHRERHSHRHEHRRAQTRTQIRTDRPNSKPTGPFGPYGTATQANSSIGESHLFARA